MLDQIPADCAWELLKETSESMAHKELWSEAGPLCAECQISSHASLWEGVLLDRLRRGPASLPNDTCTAPVKNLLPIGLQIPRLDDGMEWMMERNTSLLKGLFFDSCLDTFWCCCFCGVTHFFSQMLWISLHVFTGQAASHKDFIPRYFRTIKKRRGLIICANTLVCSKKFSHTHHFPPSRHS